MLKGTVQSAVQIILELLRLALTLMGLFPDNFSGFVFPKIDSIDGL